MVNKLCDIHSISSYDGYICPDSELSCPECSHVATTEAKSEQGELGQPKRMASWQDGETDAQQPWLRYYRSYQNLVMSLLATCKERVQAYKCVGFVIGMTNGDAAKR